MKTNGICGVYVLPTLFALVYIGKCYREKMTYQIVYRHEIISNTHKHTQNRLAYLFQTDYNKTEMVSLVKRNTSFQLFCLVLFTFVLFFPFFLESILISISSNKTLNVLLCRVFPLSMKNRRL